MGNNLASGYLEQIWPVVQKRVYSDFDRYAIYDIIVDTMEQDDADTLEEVVDCAPRGTVVDPVLICVLIDRGHMGYEDGV